MPDKMTIAALQEMKRDGKKSIGVVAWDYQIARIADRAGVDFVSVGDSVGVNLWGRDEVLEVTLDEMLICCQAVRRGTARALVSCDMPFGPVQQGIDSALAAASRLMKDGGADMIKVDAAADFPDVVRALVRAGVPVFAQFAAGGSHSRSGRKTRRRGKTFGRRRRGAARLHQFRCCRRRRRRQGGEHSGDRR